MNFKLFVNLAIHDIQRTNQFFQKLGFEFNPQYSNEDATCMVLNEGAYVMLLREPFFQNFTKLPISNAKQATEVLLAIDRPSRKAVDEFLEIAIQEGAKESREVQDLGFMYSRAFQDLDGHIWEVFFMEANPN